MLLIFGKVTLNLLSTAFGDGFRYEESDLDRMQLDEAREPDEHRSCMSCITVSLSTNARTWSRRHRTPATADREREEMFASHHTLLSRRCNEADVSQAFR